MENRLLSGLEFRIDSKVMSGIWIPIVARKVAR